MDILLYLCFSTYYYIVYIKKSLNTLKINVLSGLTFGGFVYFYFFGLTMM